MKKNAKVTFKIVGGAILIFIGGILVACDNGNGTQDPTCSCTTNLHVTGENCCGHGSCETVEGIRHKGIAITNRGAGADFGATRDNVVSALDYFTGNKETYIKDTIKEIKVIANNGSDVTIAGGVMTVRVGHTGGDIYGALNTHASHIAMLQKVPTSRENVVFEKQFNRTNQIVKATRARVIGYQGQRMA